MSFLRLSLIVFLVVTFCHGNVYAQKADSGAVENQMEVSSSGFLAPAAADRERDFPIHVTDILNNRPEVQQALRQHQETTNRLRPGYDTQASESEAEIGDRRMIRLYNFEKTESNNVVFDDVQIELRAIGDLSEIWVEVEELDSDKITQEVVDAMMVALEDETPERSYDPNRGVIEIGQELFGSPPDVDRTGKVKLFLVNVQDGWDPDDGGGFIAGFFYGLDLSLTDANSNRGDIIYVNTYPGIYTDERPARPDARLSTIAHEYQHLIHANYGNLNTFQNEGQSELAEVLSGYEGRPMTFLDDPEEVSGNVSTAGIYRWRSNDATNVLLDYQRAGLFHSYLSERVGALEAGRLTRSGSTGRRGYETVLTNNGIDWEDFLTDFYVTNWVNDTNIEGRFGYDLPQFRNVQVNNPGLTFNSSSEERWVLDQEVSMVYGGANYTNWFGVKDLNLSVNPAEGVNHYIASQRPEDVGISLRPLDGSHVFEGFYESITLISVNTRARSSEINPGSRSFTFSADWDRTNLAQKNYQYYGDIAAYVELFGDEPDATAYSVRFTPHDPGNIRSLYFVINNRPQGISGDGTLRVTLSDSRVARQRGTPEEVRVPANTIATKDVPISNIAQGTNFVNVDAAAWQVNKNQDYHITFEIIDGSPDSRLEFLVDGGSQNQNDDNYYPVRTIVYVEEPVMEESGWYRYTKNNNLIAGMTLNYPDDSLAEIVDGNPPYASTFELEQNYPNPFNPRTTIRYNLVEDVFVRLDVYDVLGRRVATLVDEEQTIGSYNAQFDATGMASGIYLYRLQAGDFTETGKMTLTK